MKFSRGDLVYLAPLAGGVVELSASPLAFSFDKLNATGYMFECDVGTVIDLDKNDCSAVFIITPRGTGWVAGAFLKKIN